MAQEKVAKQLQIDLIHLQLKMGESKKQWLNPKTLEMVSVEEAVLGHYELEGWRGYSKEGGLLLNLIKAMSFKKIPLRNRSTYIEALYAQNVAFDEDRFQHSELLDNVRNATRSQIKKNFEIMIGKESHIQDEIFFNYKSNTSMLDFFPDLKEWMFLELFEHIGAEKIFQITEIFSKNPYEYRKGWPDLTIWKDNQVKFLEVKGPSDSLHKSQKVIIENFIKPLGLNFALVDVQES